MMAYRAEHHLQKIPLSKSLTIVARTHVRDLMINHPMTGACNMHSWSAKGPWTVCCYTDDHANARLMWSKPGELTRYPGFGFEIASQSDDTLSMALTTLQSWKDSPHHNDVILNKSIWKTSDWNAIGIGIFGNYAVAWFGKETDPDGPPTPESKSNP